LTNSVWPRRTPRSSLWKSRGQGCSAFGGAVRVSGLGYAPCSPGRSGLHTGRGLSWAVPNEGTVAKLVVPRPASRMRKPKRKLAGRPSAPLGHELPGARPARVKARLRTARSHRVYEPDSKTGRSRTPAPTAAPTPRPRAAGGVREGVDARPGSDRRTARKELPTKLPVESVGAPDHLRRCK
jgi:hypothetical protein